MMRRRTTSHWTSRDRFSRSVPTWASDLSTGQHWLLLVNPCAGNGRGGRIYSDVSDLLNVAGIHHVTRFSRDGSHLSELAVEAALEEQISGIAVLGGDGSAALACRGLLQAGKRMPLAVIPCGSGNDWCRTLGTGTVPSAVKAIASGKTRILDAGRFSVPGDPSGKEGGIPFINSAGIGLDAHVLRKSLSLRRRIPFGKAAYISALLATLVEMPLWEGTIEVDDEVVYSGKYLSLTVGVCPFVGGGMMLSPSSKPDDGLLDGTVVTPISRTRLVRSLPQVYRGTLLDNPSVESWRGKRLLIRSESGFRVELDGESIEDPEPGSAVLIESIPDAIEAVVGNWPSQAGPQMASTNSQTSRG